MNTPTPEQNEKIPAEQMQKLCNKLDDLKNALEKKDPQMSQHLRESHMLLISFPETTHLLEDHEIKLLLDAAQKHTEIEIVKAATSKGGKGSRSKVNVDEL